MNDLNYLMKQWYSSNNTPVTYQAQRNCANDPITNAQLENMRNMRNCSAEALLNYNPYAAMDTSLSKLAANIDAQIWQQVGVQINRDEPIPQSMSVKLAREVYGVPSPKVRVNSSEYTQEEFDEAMEEVNRFLGHDE